MKKNGCVVALMALFLSMGAAYAQTQPDVHIAKPSLTPEAREARKAEHKAKMATLTPAERKAFRQARQEQRQARQNALTPEAREARKAEHKAKMAALTPAERKAFRQAHQEQRQARLNAMTPEQRAKHEEQRRLRKEAKREGK